MKIGIKMNKIGSSNIIIMAGLISVLIAVATFLIGMMHEVQDERLKNEYELQVSEKKSLKDEDKTKFKPKGHLVKNPVITTTLQNTKKIKQ